MTAGVDFEEQLIGQLILDDSSIDQTASAIFKTVFAAGRQSEFLSVLTSFGGRKEKEIERTCQQNFEQFTRCFDGYLELASEVGNLKVAGKKVQEEFAQCGQLLYDSVIITALDIIIVLIIIHVDSRIVRNEKDAAEHQKNCHSIGGLLASAKCGSTGFTGDCRQKLWPCSTSS